MLICLSGLWIFMMHIYMYIVLVQKIHIHVYIYKYLYCMIFTHTENIHINMNLHSVISYPYTSTHPYVSTTSFPWISRYFIIVRHRQHCEGRWNHWGWFSLGEPGNLLVDGDVLMQFLMIPKALAWVGTTAFLAVGEGFVSELGKYMNIFCMFNEFNEVVWW